MTRTSPPAPSAPFWFTPQAATWWPDRNRRLFVANAPTKPAHKDGLMQALADELRFQAGAARSWDALTEALRDLSWLRCDDVVLIHRRIPDLPRGLLAGYFDALMRAHSNRARSAPKLHIVFPIELWSDVTALSPPF